MIVQSSAMLLDAPSSQASATRPNLGGPGGEYGHFNDGGSIHGAFSSGSTSGIGNAQSSSMASGGH